MITVSGENVSSPMSDVSALGKGGTGVDEPRNLDRHSLSFWRRPSVGRLGGVIIGLIVVCAYMGLTNPLFLSWGNILNIFRAQSVIFILAIGMTFVVLCGMLDLSVASATGVAAMLLGMSIEAGSGPITAILVAVVAGMALGFINGFLVGIVRISWFVTTLATLSIYASMILVVTSGSTISLFKYDNFKSIQYLANRDIGPIPIVLIAIAVMYLISWFVLHRTTFGRAVYAVGANPEAARLNGINVPLTLTIVFAIAGLTCGIGAIQQTGRLTAAVPTTDPNQMLAVIAAVLIGGMSLKGGEGGLMGTFLGTLFLGVIQNSLTLQGISAFWQGTVTGSILILAAGLAVIRQSEFDYKLGRNLRSLFKKR